MNKKATLKGVIPPIGTPLTDGHGVDELGLRRLVPFLLDTRVHGIISEYAACGCAE